MPNINQTKAFHITYGGGDAIREKLRETLVPFTRSEQFYLNLYLNEDNEDICIIRIICLNAATRRIINCFCRNEFRQSPSFRKALTLSDTQETVLYMYVRRVYS